MIPISRFINLYYGLQSEHVGMLNLIQCHNILYDDDDDTMRMDTCFSSLPEQYGSSIHSKNGFLVGGRRDDDMLKKIDWFSIESSWGESWFYGETTTMLTLSSSTFYFVMDDWRRIVLVII